MRIEELLEGRSGEVHDAVCHEPPDKEPRRRTRGKASEQAGKDSASDRSGKDLLLKRKENTRSVQNHGQCGLRSSQYSEGSIVARSNDHYFDLPPAAGFLQFFP